MRSFSRRSGFRPVSKRLTAWDSGPRSDNGAGFSVSSTGTVWNVGMVPLIPVTLVRIRGVITFFFDSVTAAADAWTVAVGIGLIATDAFTAGALPDPLADDLWEGWMWHHYLHMVVPAGTTANLAPVRLEIDSKAMRKVDPGMTLFGITEAAEQNDGSTFIQYANTRILSKT